jgi:signal transduction histidine kinase
VRGDLNQLADSCFNLLTNAYDAIQKKGTLIQTGQISPSPNDPVPFRGKIVVRVYLEKKEDQPAKVVLEIQDNGTGMMASELDSLFIPFFTTKATAQKGTGLGLYVIQRIVEQHGGSIKAASKYGAGTTFTMRLPVFEGGVPTGQAEAAGG